MIAALGTFLLLLVGYSVYLVGYSNGEKNGNGYPARIEQSLRAGQYGVITQFSGSTVYITVVQQRSMDTDPTQQFRFILTSQKLEPGIYDLLGTEFVPVKVPSVAEAFSNMTASVVVSTN